MSRSPPFRAGVQHLEEESGVAIVKRAQRFEGFTAEGERVLAWAQHIQANWDGLNRTCVEMCGDPTGELRCGDHPHNTTHCLLAGRALAALVTQGSLIGPPNPAVQTIRRIEALHSMWALPILNIQSMTNCCNCPFTHLALRIHHSRSAALCVTPGYYLVRSRKRSRCVCSRRTCKIGVSLTPRLTKRA